MRKKIFKFIIGIVLIFIMVLVTFFYWASSSNLNEDEYAKIIVNDIEESVTKDSIFSIITYNVGYLSGMTNNRAVEKPKNLFEKNLILVKNELKKINPDIIAFQEIDYNASRSFNVNQQNEIADLGYKYIAQAINWDEKYVPFPYYPFSVHFGKLISGQSVLSKYPITSQQRIVLQRDETNWFYRDAFYIERLIQISKITINAKEIVIMNVHLDAFNYDLRRKQLKAVLVEFERLRKQHPVLLLGDFNSDPQYENAAIKILIDDTSVGNAAFEKENYDFTFNTKHAFERLDYIFYDKETISLVEAAVLKSFKQASDHFPVHMKFRLK